MNNSFGELYRITTWGESHGKAIGVVIDGCPAGMKLSAGRITEFCRKNDRPIPEIATARVELNQIHIVSGVYKGKTLGTPISILINNLNIKPDDYKSLSTAFRPGHGDFTYFKKYNYYGIPGGGRASGRECITRIIAGYIAGRIIKNHLNNYTIKSRIISLAGMNIRNKKELNKAINKVIEIGKTGDSTGGTIKLIVRGVPAGIGDPVFYGINARLSYGLMSIKTIKSIEFGIGKKCAKLKGSEYNDDFYVKNGKQGFVSNNNGGTLSGITSGQDIIIKLSVKPVPSIKKMKSGLTIENKIQNISVNGRHDMNITPRIIPIAKAMINIILLDHLMICGLIRRDRV